MDWTNRFLKGKGKNPLPCFYNAALVLNEAPEWKGILGFDVFALRTMLLAQPPWDASFHSNWIARPWTPQDDLECCFYLQHKYKIITSFQIIEAAIEMVARQYSFHPVIDFLDNTTWDSVPRIDTWMSDYLGCPDTPYVRAVSANFPIGAIARIRQPGCQCDAFPVLEAVQGVGKSTAARTLFEPWFSDEVNDLGSKDASMQVSGVWCIEISELDAMSRNEISKIKAFISRRVDRFRPPYGRRVIEHPRDCVFMGTTNATGYLRDETGSRRILPVVCSKVDLDGLLAVRDQIFAEADCKFAQGAKWWIADPTLKLAAQDEQAARYVGDPWTDAVVEYITHRVETSISDILETQLCVPIDRQDQVAMNRVSRVLIANGYERYQKRDGDRRTWMYRKINPDDSAQPILSIVKSAKGE